MTKIHIPDPFHFESVEGLFQNLLDLNKENSSFTHRQFAKELNWPTSLCGDLANKRKKLSVQRALEFSLFAKFNSLETEKMIWLTVKESISDKVRAEVFDKKVIHNLNDNQFEDTQNKKIIYDTKAMVVFAVLKWSRGLLSGSEIKELVRTFSIDTKEVEKAIGNLIEDGIIKNTNGKLEIINNKLILDEDMFQGLEIHIKHAESFIKFCQDPQTPSGYNCGFIEIPRARFMEVGKKIIALRNWLMDIGEETNKMDKKYLDETLIAQFDLNLFPIIDKEAAKEIALKRDGQSYKP